MCHTLYHIVFDVLGDSWQSNDIFIFQNGLLIKSIYGASQKQTLHYVYMGSVLYHIAWKVRQATKYGFGGEGVLKSYFHRNHCQKYVSYRNEKRNNEILIFEKKMDFRFSYCFSKN